MAAKNRRKPQAKRKQNRQPASTWLLLGALGGVLITSGLFIKLTNDSGQTTPDVAKKSQASTTTLAHAQEAAPQAEQPRFHFYTMLQNMQQQKSTPPPTELPVRPPTLALKPQNLPTSEYLIQVGSFRAQEDATKLKAELILSGYDVKLDPVKVKHDTWYRVQIGPFASKEVAQAKQKVLEQQKFHGTLILKKDTG